VNVHVTLSLDPKLLEEFDAWLKREGAKSRSEAVAKLIEKALKETNDRS